MTLEERSTIWLTIAPSRSILNHMVEQVGELDAVFHALANGARREMLNRLAERPLTVGELAQPLAMSLAAASKHIKVLERVGLVQQTIAGRQHVCRLVAVPLAPAADWLRFYERHWEDRLDLLEDLFRTGPALDSPALGKEKED
jgi:DNA-binding transcriptional ArsR family regulator